MTKPIDDELVILSREGDREAFGQLVERYQTRVYSTALGMLKDEEEAREVAQIAMVKAFRNIERFRGDCSFNSWLYRITVNACLDHLRRAKRRRSVEYEDSWPPEDKANVHPLSGNTRDMEPDVKVDREQMSEILHDAMDQLSEKHLAVILLREVEGLSYEEIAEVMECHLGTVMSRLHHARKNLQLALQPHLEELGDPLAKQAGAGVRKSKKRKRR